MPRYVVLRHEMPEGSARPSHWDFMLEEAGSLRTWALSEAPDTAGPVEAQHLPNHRLAYLDDEGPVSQDRGTVVRWDGGHYTSQQNQPGRCEVTLQGERLRGRVRLTRDAQSDQRWVFLFESESA
jgi:hypothetical protein